MRKYYRTDLACEASSNFCEIEGTVLSKKKERLCTVESLEIQTDEAAKRLNHVMGNYITLSTGAIWLFEDSEISELAGSLAKELKSMLLHSCGIKSITRDFSVLVVGLGNASITADAIGPWSVDSLTVTRHIKAFAPEIFEQMNTCNISALVPGVLGKTGIESSETVKAAIETVKPDVLIVIDALAAGSIERLATTVQLSNTGITPGAGIGNLRSELSFSTLNTPVISIGVPTVVDSSTMVYDVLTRSGIVDIPKEIIEYLERGIGYYVTPKETDVISQKVSRLISEAISSALSI